MELILVVGFRMSQIAGIFKRKKNESCTLYIIPFAKIIGPVKE